MELTALKLLFFSKITDKIVKEVASWSVEDIEVKFKLKSEQAKKLSDFYKILKKKNLVMLFPHIQELHIKKYMQMN